jgi:hypothetical protein
MMDSSPITHGAANSFLGKKESRTDIDRAVDEEGVVTVAKMFLRSEAEEMEVEEKALAVEPRVVDAKSSKE